ncbi:MAG TPA: glycosyltransferase, partial [Chroococcales cyanobacterium]
MRRVLLTVHKFFPEHRAGTEVLTLKVAQELQRRGTQVLVVTASPPDLDARHAVGPPSSDYVYEGVDVHVVGESLRLKNYTFAHEYFHPEIKQHFAEVLDSFQPTLVHIFHAQNLSASIIDACEEKGVPVICSTTDFWFVCPVVQLKRPDGALCRGPDASASNCLTCYTPELIPPREQVQEAIVKKYPAAAGLLRAIPGFMKGTVASTLRTAYWSTKLPEAVSATRHRPAVLRQAANRTGAIMVPTMLMRDIFVENGIREDLLHHVPFGLDTALLVEHQKKTASPVIRFAFIGTIFEHKGLDLLIEAFQHLPPESAARLTIYGDLNQFPEYGRRMKELAERPLPNSAKIE